MTKVLGESEVLTVWEVTVPNHCLAQGSTVFYRMFLCLDLSDIFALRLCVIGKATIEMIYPSKYRIRGYLVQMLIIGDVNLIWLWWCCHNSPLIFSPS